MAQNDDVSPVPPSGRDDLPSGSVKRGIKLAGLPLPAETDFEVTGAEPILASPHFLATGAAAAFSPRKRSRG